MRLWRRRPEPSAVGVELRIRTAAGEILRMDSEQLHHALRFSRDRLPDEHGWTDLIDDLDSAGRYELVVEARPVYTGGGLGRQPNTWPPRDLKFAGPGGSG